MKRIIASTFAGVAMMAVLTVKSGDTMISRFPLSCLSMLPRANEPGGAGSLAAEETSIGRRWYRILHFLINV